MLGICGLLALGALLLSGPAIASSSDKTITTTIPYLGWPTKTTTLPVCSGTVTVVVETRLPGIDKCRHTTSTKTTKASPTTISTKTTKAKHTPTPSGACVNVNPLCSPDGFNIAYYFNMLGGYSDPYGGVESNYYIVDNLKPLKTSMTNETFFPQNQAGSGAQSFPNASIPTGPFSYTQFPSVAGYVRETNGGIKVDANNFTLVYSGYFRPPSSGLWNICASADNENDIYFGDGNGFNCLNGKPGTAADPLVQCSGGYFNNVPQCAQVNLIEGAFYPFRSVYANWQGPSGLNITMVPPGGDVAKGSHDFSGHAYPLSCGVDL